MGVPGWGKPRFPLVRGRGIFEPLTDRLADPPQRKRTAHARDHAPSCAPPARGPGRGRTVRRRLFSPRLADVLPGHDDPSRVGRGHAGSTRPEAPASASSNATASQCPSTSFGTRYHLEPRGHTVQRPRLEDDPRDRGGAHPPLSPPLPDRPHLPSRALSGAAPKTTTSSRPTSSRRTYFPDANRPSRIASTILTLRDRGALDLREPPGIDRCPPARRVGRPPALDPTHSGRRPPVRRRADQPQEHPQALRRQADALPRRPLGPASPRSSTSTDGRPKSPTPPRPPLCPRLRRACAGDPRLGHVCIVLSPNQEIKVFAAGTQAFSFAHGRWRILDPSAKFALWRKP